MAERVCVVLCVLGSFYFHLCFLSASLKSRTTTTALGSLLGSGADRPLSASSQEVEEKQKVSGRYMYVRIRKARKAKPKESINNNNNNKNKSVRRTKYRDTL